MRGRAAIAGMRRSATPQPKKRPAWMVGGATIVSLRRAALRHRDSSTTVTGHRLDDNGIRPLETDGLWGILFAPLLHANWPHLIANTGPALVLGFLMTLAGLSRFICATAIIWVLGGFGTWLIGNVGRTDLQRNGGRDQPHRRLRPDLRLADLPDRVRLLHPQGLGDRRRRRRALRLRQHPARRAAGERSGCPGRAICAGRSPESSPPICCPGPSARRAVRRKRTTSPPYLTP